MIKEYGIILDQNYLIEKEIKELFEKISKLDILNDFNPLNLSKVHTTLENLRKDPITVTITTAQSEINQLESKPLKQAILQKNFFHLMTKLHTLCLKDVFLYQDLILPICHFILLTAREIDYGESLSSPIYQPGKNLLAERKNIIQMIVTKLLELIKFPGNLIIEKIEKTFVSFESATNYHDKIEILSEFIEFTRKKLKIDPSFEFMFLLLEPHDFLPLTLNIDVDFMILYRVMHNRDDINKNRILLFFVHFLIISCEISPLPELAKTFAVPELWQYFPGFGKTSVSHQ